MWRADTQKTNAQLSAQINARVNTISFEIHRYEDLVKTVQAYAEGMDGPIAVNEYAIIVSRLLLDRKGIQAPNYAPRVLWSERNAFEAQARDQGLIDFRITESDLADGVRTAGDRSEYFPIYDAYPTKGNEAALGLDVTSARVPIFNAARDSGNDIASPPFRFNWSWRLCCIIPARDKGLHPPLRTSEHSEGVRHTESGHLVEHGAFDRSLDPLIIKGPCP
jgi:CHASE1-domain containing sensor protein